MRAISGSSRSSVRSSASRRSPGSSTTASRCGPSSSCGCGARLGYYAIIYLAGLQTVPAELQEAARIDGASRWQVFRYVTLPTMRPVMLVCVVISTISALEMFDEPMILTQGGPADSTLTVAMYLYQQGFQFLQLGHAAAASYVLTLIILLISVAQRLTIGREAK
jgi:ABC-type sugar transport system permease subunit